MSFTTKITRRARPMGVALAAIFLFGATSAAAQERDWDQEQPQEREHETQQIHDQDLTAATQNIEEISLFVQALRQTDLDQAIQMEGQYTIFAPTNEAMQSHFSDEELERMGLKVKDAERAEREYEPATERDERDGEYQDEDRPVWDEDTQARDREMKDHRAQAQLSPEDREELTRFVRAHIVVGQLTADQLGTTQEIQNVLGQNLEVEVDEDARREARERDLERADREQQDQWEAEHARVEFEETGVQIDNVEVVHTDVRAANAIVHVIDGVIEPAEPEEIREEREEREQDWQDREDPFEDDDPFEGDDPFEDDPMQDDRPAR